ncbi:MAG: chromosome segregation protein SMC [Lacipirellulaceae bacterium]
MLQALELNGFKSFAEKTRFDFPAGITVVVGPNGSGKSNVVDAVKWVLGAQSAKMLRGKEMADVIFSGTPKRRPSGAAEVSLRFDNTENLLGHDSAELEITRRVFRSGESEYLLNRQPCRLRDLRDVLSGTGMAGGAYSIIEQGKVDALLQSSPADRRQIFEEAAGISRFKTKRQDAARRLDRVQQNLLRLTDIVEELQSQLTKVRSQAGRARQYKDVHSRLRELQIKVAVADWNETSQQLEVLDSHIQAVGKQQSQFESELDRFAAASQQHEQQLEDLQSSLREATVGHASAKERIHHCQTNQRRDRERLEELSSEIESVAIQTVQLAIKVQDSDSEYQHVDKLLAEAEAKFCELKQLADSRDSQLEEAEHRLEQLKRDRLTAEEQLSESEKLAADDRNRVEVLKERQQSAQEVVSKGSQETWDLQTSLGRLTAQLNSAAEILEAVQSRHQAATTNLRQAQSQLTDDRRTLSQLHKQEAELQGKLTGARERSVVLAELEKRLDGLSAGTREVLRQAQENPEGPYGAVRGVVADLLHVDADSAQMIELALGERANYLVVEDVQRLSGILEDSENELPARTVFLRLDVSQPPSAVDRVDLSDQPGVMGRADRFVEVDESLQPVVRRLLGRYWFVDSLETALQLSMGAGRGLSFITVSGEVVGAEGVVAVGPRKQSAGLLSRRNELRAIEEQIQLMQHDLSGVQQRAAEVEQRIANHDATLQTLTNTFEQAREEAHEAELSHAAIEERYEEMQAKLASLIERQQSSQTGLESLDEEIEACLARIEKSEQRSTELKSQVADTAKQFTELEQLIAGSRRESTKQQVELASAEQRRDSFHEQLEKLARERNDRRQLQAEAVQRLAKGKANRLALNLTQLDQTGEIAEQHTRLDHWQREQAILTADYQDLQRSKSEVSQQAESLRKELQQIQQQSQKLLLEKQQVESQRRTLSERLREQHRLELAIIAKQAASNGQPQEPIINRAEIDREIADLKTQLQASGPVNLEAVEELDALEERFRSLAEQHDDLQTARARLEQIVEQINKESRQIFLNTIEEVRGHFKELFANLFGGGEADIVIENEPEKDILECGIEIVARPPGKQPRSISLLSGGERTLTCVALLLAIFRSRPSPFCILDEVDAALDEANIDRFVEVLKEFMSSTQFIVITHSKRTMTCSDTLYGVTMQESGVSKRVSVRFEDVTHDGHIKPAAIKRAA